MRSQYSSLNHVRCLFRSLLLGVWFFPYGVSGLIQTAHTVSDIEHHIQQQGVEETTLVCFDMDATLIEPEAPAFQRNIYKKIPSIQDFKEHIPAVDQGPFISYILLTETVRLVQPELPSLMARLKHKGAKVLVVTASSTSTIPNFGNIVVKRYALLRLMGYPLANPFAANLTPQFKDLTAAYDRCPQYYKGVLGTNGRKYKGPALVSLLHQAAYVPKKIVFIDDMKANVERVERYVRKHLPDVEFLGIYYDWYSKDKPHAMPTQSEADGYYYQWVQKWKDYQGLISDDQVQRGVTSADAA